MISPDSSVGQGYQYFGLQKFLVLGQVLKNFWRLFFCRLLFPSHKNLFFKASFYQFTKIICRKNKKVIKLLVERFSFVTVNLNQQFNDKKEVKIFYDGWTEEEWYESKK